MPNKRKRAGQTKGPFDSPLACSARSSEQTFIVFMIMRSAQDVKLLLKI
ncbi:hypothetical protein HMPREF9436_02045 [Faecalibacterium cf. prausnitzii KLE1255]|uniref:Uncharacterized protein n=1 Tax=Faecalibacterium cf. prausnitzii KLE1255 TaxID=748224 RepID=E2ZK43_9FIRM|nr:hypothetical protein HMPREF9436_02045 [Faecalibacterium cf. prausnitzii KLE1255]